MPKKNGKMKKTVIFIVEGSSDKKALERIFKVIYKEKNITFEFTRGDVTSNNAINRENVLDCIYEKVSERMRDSKLRKNDIWKIVQIFDTDGAYIPEASVVRGETTEFIYSPTHISCKNTNKILERNMKKREMMDYLLSINEIKGIPYDSYYMSSNLDHALYDEQNLEQDIKEDMADAFYSIFEGKERLFIDFLQEEVSNGVPDTYPSSWIYIKEGVHSLERHSNLHIYFKDNPYD